MIRPPARWAPLVLPVLFLFTAVPVAEARLLNLGGQVDLVFSDSSVRQGSRQTDLRTFEQRYNLRSFGEIWDPRLGSYTASVTWLDENFNSSIAGGDQDFKILDYHLGLSFFPSRQPISLFAQRVTTERESQTPGSLPERFTNTTYSLTWDMKLRRAPRLRLNLYQNELRSGQADQLDLRTRAASLDSDGRIGRTRASGRYQFSDVDVTGGGTGGRRTHTFNGALETDFRPGLTGRAYGSYSTGTGTIGTLIPGIEIFQEKSAGAGLFYRPRVALNASATYDFFETPGGPNTTLKRHLFRTALSSRPIAQLDFSSGYTFLLFDLLNAQVRSHSASSGLTWRPIFGLSTGGNLTVGRTTTTGVTSSENDFFTLSGFGNYFQTLPFFRWNAGYSASLGQSEFGTAGEKSTDLAQTVTAGIDNTRTRVVHVGANYTYSELDRKTGGVSTGDQRAHRVQVLADSSYPRDLLVRGDSLFLQSSATYHRIDGFGAQGNTYLLDANATYNFLYNVVVFLGVTHEDYPRGFTSDRDSAVGRLQWSRYFFWSLNIGADLRGQVDEFDTAPDRKLYEARTFAGYQLGAISFSSEYRLSRENVDGGAGLDTDIFLLRASRPF